MKKFLLILFGLMFSSTCFATTITYEGELTNGFTAHGKVEPGELDSGYDWWWFSADIADIITITVQRLETAFDPAFKFFEGGGTNTNTDDLTFVYLGDDEIPPLDPYISGPSWDAQLYQERIETGDIHSNDGEYSVQVFSTYASGDPGDDGYFDYQITLDIIKAVDGNGNGNGNGTEPATVPEPATFFLFGIGLLSAASVSRFKLKE